MKPSTFFNVIAAAAIAVTLTLSVAPRSAALAQGGMAQSNQNLDTLANRINQDIAALNGDDTDYGGHRVNAIRLMQAAHKQVADAEQFAATHGAGAGAVNPGAATAYAGGGVRRQQGNSDANVNNVRSDLQTILNQMNADPADYNGYKGKAAKELSNAVVELGKALEYRQTHVPH